MSLDVRLKCAVPVIKKGTGVFIRESGTTKELTVKEAREKFPNADVEEKEFECEYVYRSNITHNLNRMAKEAGIYQTLWYPEEIGKAKASEIIELLEKGLEKLKARPEHFEKFNSPNGWGKYEQFVPFVEKYLNACKEHPETIIEISR